MKEKILISHEGDIRGVFKTISTIAVVFAVIFLLKGANESQWVYNDSATWYTIGGFFGFIAIVLFIINLCMSTTELTVTDKRVYGQTAFKKRVDLPLDSISAVGTGMFGSFSVATSSGRISFIGLPNKEEYQKCISDLLIQRNRNTVQDIPQSNSSVDELKKLKELLDMGVLTQEEFEAKKKQILDL